MKRTEIRRGLCAVALILAVCLLPMLGGCARGTEGSGDVGGNTGDGVTSAGESLSLVAPDFAGDPSEMFTDRDGRDTYDESGAVRITLTGETATATSDAVRIEGGRVTVTAEATYYITGTLNGQIIVDAPETAKLQLVLDGVSVTSATSAALYVLECDKTVVTLAENSVNTLQNGGEFVAIDENAIDAAIFSKQDLTLNGTGSLTVVSPAGHGIVSKDDLVFTGGTYAVTAASHGVDANDSVRITGAEFTVKAGKDAIRAENNEDTALGFVYIENGTFDLTAEGDGISAGAYLQIGDGTFRITAGGGSKNGAQAGSDGYGTFPGGGFGGFGAPSASDADSTSMKGLKGQTGVLISGGTFTVDSADDAVHSNLSVTVNGGTFDLATGDDGFHADESLTVAAGTVRISESYEGLEALNVVITGGEISLKASDDGINAAGGVDASGMGGRGDDQFGGGTGGRPRPRSGIAPPAGMGGASSGGSIVISGGNLYIEASGDGIDANGTLEITGGYTVVCGPTRGDTAVLDYDRSATITGGTFIGTGASNMAQSIDGTVQGVIAVRLSNQTEGTEISITDADGREIVRYAPALSFGLIVVSTPELVKGETYTLTVGALSESFEAN